jgi:hypothetical protein
VQNHRLPTPAFDRSAAELGFAPAPDSSVELWIDPRFDENIDTAQAAAASDALEQDEREFVEPSKVSAFLAIENILYPMEGSATERPVGATKLVCQLFRNTGFTVKRFERQLRVSCELAIREATENIRIRRLVHSSPIPSGSTEQFGLKRGWRNPPDALIEIWFETEGNEAGSTDDPRFLNALRSLVEHHKPHLEIERMTTFLAVEYEVFRTAGREEDQGL